MHYRKIYEDYHKCSLLPEIEIHHIDGNRNNNDPSNLLAVTIEEHLDIHYKQKDWGAVQAIIMRMENKDGIREAASKFQLKKLENGKHNFQKITKERRTEISKKTMEERLANGNGAFLIADKIENSRNAGLISKQKKTGFHDPNKTGGVFVRGTCWWTNKSTGKKVRQKECPGEGWNKGMK